MIRREFIERTLASIAALFMPWRARAGEPSPCWTLRYVLQDFNSYHGHCYNNHGQGEPPEPLANVEMIVRWHPGDGLAALFARCMEVKSDMDEVADFLYKSDPKFGPGSGNTLSVRLVSVQGPGCDQFIDYRKKHTSDLWIEQEERRRDVTWNRSITDSEGRMAWIEQSDLFSLRINFNHAVV